MKNLSLATTLTILASPSFAADLARAPAAPAFDWTGAFVGVTAGAAWHDASVTNNGTSAVYLAQGDSISFDRAGFIGGILAGYNWRYQNLLYGVEADISATSAGGSAWGGNGANAYFKSDLNWLGTVRGRIGVIYDRTLFYATGGLAYGSVHSRLEEGGSIGYTTRDVRTGWAVGGGIEQGFGAKTTLKAEALYYDLGSVNRIDSSGYYGPYEDKARGAIARIGMNFKF